MREVSPKDLMLAMRAGDGQFDPDVPLSAVLRAEIERDGKPQRWKGASSRARAISARATIRDTRIHIDEAQLDLRWNAATRQLQMPFEVLSGPSRVSLPGAARRAGRRRTRRGRSRSRAARGVRLRRPLARSAAHPRPRRAARAHRPGQAAVRNRSGRTRQRPAASRSPARSTIRPPIRGSRSALPARA